MIAGLPYDAEVEWIESVKPSYIDTGIRYLEAYTVVLDMAFMNGSSNLDTGLGSSGDAIGTLRVWPGVNRIQFAWYGGFTTITTDGTELYERHLYEFGPSGIFFDGNQKSQYSSRGDSEKSLKLAGYNEGNTERQGACRFWSFKISNGNTILMDLIPVRFTNSNGQSEGAMYDRVSRKLFRNAGTGAFVIGPDVATPVMGLHFMRRPKYTARDYVQNGLIAMWDGIENAGWGMHDPNATTWADLTGGGAGWLLKDANTTQVFEVGADYVKILSTMNYSGRGYCTPSWASVDDLISFEIVFDADSVDMTTITNCRRIVGFMSSGSGNRSLWLQSGYVSCGFDQYPCTTVPQGVNSLSLDFGVQRAMLNSSFFDSARRGPGWIGMIGPSIGGYGYGDAYVACGCKIKAMRLYGRSLTDSERLANYAVDRVRFNLPPSS